MKKQTIKLNESRLRQVIKESIKNVLNEGKVVNNKKDYFGDFFKNPEFEYGNYYDKLASRSHFAKRDDERDPIEDKKYKTLYNQVSREWEPGDENYINVTDPGSEFDVAYRKHDMRADRAEHIGGFDTYDAGAVKEVARLGIPMKIAYKLSDNTLQLIIQELSGKTPGSHPYGNPDRYDGDPDKHYKREIRKRIK